jgi:hypothetical protein
MRTPDVSELSASELGDARRELAVSVALSRPDSPIQLPLQAQMLAVDAEIVSRRVKICSCGMATDNAEILDGHLFEEPSHYERNLQRYFA